MAKKKPFNVSTFMADADKMALVEELCTTGASISTIEASLGLSQGILRKWLNKGAVEPKTAYRRFYNLVRGWIAIARGAAEAQQLVKTPTQWLEKNSSAKLLNEPVDVISSEAPALPQKAQIAIGVQATINAMKVLQDSGISIDDMLRKDQLHITVNPE